MGKLHPYSSSYPCQPKRYQPLSATIIKDMAVSGKMRPQGLPRPGHTTAGLHHQFTQVVPALSLAAHQD